MEKKYRNTELYNIAKEYRNTEKYPYYGNTEFYNIHACPRKIIKNVFLRYF